MAPKNLLNTLFFLSLLYFLPLSSGQAFGQTETQEQKILRLANAFRADENTPCTQKAEQEREKEQIRAVSELSTMGTEAVPLLIQELKRNNDSEVLDSIARALGAVGKDAVPTLALVLDEELKKPADSQNIKVVRYASNALKFIAGSSKGGNEVFRGVVPDLIRILETKAHLEVSGAPNYELQDFDAAADCLQYIGREAKTTIPLLIKLLANEKYRKEQHYTKKDSIVAILKDLKIYSDFSENEAITASFNEHKKLLAERDMLEIKEGIDELNRAKDAQDFKRWLSLASAFTEHPSVMWAAIFISLILIAWFTVFLLKPILLLKLYEVFPIGETHLPTVLGTVTVPVRYLVAASALRPRVLDAWVKKHLPEARRSFYKKPTVDERRVYVPVALFLDNKLVPDLRGQNLQETFDRNQSHILISGIGGAGKTSLACQVATWAMEEVAQGRPRPKYPMIPVLLESDFVERGEEALKKTIRSQLYDSIDAPAPISNALLQALLEKKRVLVLIDGMSERNEETRAAIISGITSIPVNAVVFTSRTDETIGGLNKTVIKPTTIKGNQLSSFVETYLVSLGKKERFNDTEFFEGCHLLSAIVNDRDITALLAKLFVDLMVAKQEGGIEGELPRNIPELMLESIKVLHARTPSGDLALRDVIKSAKCIAWECLKKDYRPLPAEYTEIKKTLAGVPEGERSLIYLEDKLKLIETTSFDTQVRFKIDPLAEYLAGMYLVEENRYREEKWRRSLENALTKDRSPKDIKGFLSAVRDCCSTEDVRDDVPDFVFEVLSAVLS